MGKAKKRCGDEEGFGGGNGDAQTECPLPKLVLKVGGKEKKPKGNPKVSVNVPKHGRSSTYKRREVPFFLSNFPAPPPSLNRTAALSLSSVSGYGRDLNWFSRRSIRRSERHFRGI